MAISAVTVAVGSCAQRLTASKELERIAWGLDSDGETGAQRLTASKELEPPSGRGQGEGPTCSTPYGIKGIGTTPK